METETPRRVALHKEGWAVYRAYDQGGALLYVGFTKDLQRRLAGHAATSRWYDHAACVEWDEYDTEAEALMAEQAKIRELRPPYNQQHNQGHYRDDLEPDWVREHRAGSAVRRLQRERGVYVRP